MLTSLASTAYITFDNTKVPAENMLGKENDGLRVILSNFNHERWVSRNVSVYNQKCEYNVLTCFACAGHVLVSQSLRPDVTVAID